MSQLIMRNNSCVIGRQKRERVAEQSIWQRACRSMERLQVPGSGMWARVNVGMAAGDGRIVARE